MTDIIERLRSYRGPWLVPAEAADEIERLRDQIKTVSAMNLKLVEAHESVVAERDAAVKLLGYIRLPAQRALERVNWIRPADEPPPNFMVNWYTSADTLQELIRITSDAARGEKP